MTTKQEHRICPECGCVLEYMATWDGNRMYLCNTCLSTWQAHEDESGKEVIKRYFFG